MNTDLPVPPATQADTRPMTVLVVDDSVASAQALAMALEMDGYVAHVAFTGQSALAEASTHRPDCVLLDFGLDDMDGLQLARTLRERHGDDVVMIMITGWDTTQERVGEAAALVDHHFTKPLDLNRLRRILPPIGPPRAAG
ncbi:MAG: response regulator [Burkholderiales bacterium]|nr:response regulator [Burkholderiales bacterium]